MNDFHLGYSPRSHKSRPARGPPACWIRPPEQRSGLVPVALRSESRLFNPRNRCTIDTAVAPSPTAIAHLLTELWRTSPAANSPGILVSINIGLREWEAQYEGGSSSSIRSSPVRM